jgi:hypothetical protein
MASVGLDGYIHQNGFAVAFRDVKLRKLKAAPAPPTAARS